VKESRKDLLLYNKLINKNLIFYSVDFKQLTFCIMGQLVKDICEVFPFKNKQYISLYPKFYELFIFRLKDRTLVCCKIQRENITRGERLIKLNYSWFFTKVVLAIH